MVNNKGKGKQKLPINNINTNINTNSNNNGRPGPSTGRRRSPNLASTAFGVFNFSSPPRYYSPIRSIRVGPNRTTVRRTNISGRPENEKRTPAIVRVQSYRKPRGRSSYNLGKEIREKYEKIDKLFKLRDILSKQYKNSGNTNTLTYRNLKLIHKRIEKLVNEREALIKKQARKHEIESARLANAIEKSLVVQTRIERQVNKGMAQVKRIANTARRTRNKARTAVRSLFGGKRKRSARARRSPPKKQKRNSPNSNNTNTNT